MTEPEIVTSDGHDWPHHEPPWQHSPSGKQRPRPRQSDDFTGGPLERGLALGGAPIQYAGRRPIVGHRDTSAVTASSPSPDEPPPTRFHRQSSSALTNNPNTTDNRDRDRNDNAATYHTRPQIPSPGKPLPINSTTDPPLQPLSPSHHHRTVTTTTVTHPDSDSGSLNVRFDRSHLSSERHGNRSATHTQKSSTSQKRTTDQMHGQDATSTSDQRPAKLPYSPSSPRHTQPLHFQSANQPSGYGVYHPSVETHSPLIASPTTADHYYHNLSVTHETPKLPGGLSAQQPFHGIVPEHILIKQPPTKPITEQQLINEVKGIYAGLVMVERKCVDIINQQTNSTKRLTDQQWKALVALHRTLLQEHHDFFSASQHPTASDNLKKLAIKYAMPARMWRHGIHAFLELLRHRLPDSMEHMLSFIYLAYSMMALLKESVPGFVETWIECLGDLARYRMAIEDTDPRDREIWSNVAKMWYNEAADKSPTVGRIQHHLAVLARPNIVEQLFYYDKALVTVVPFVNARESIMLLFDMFTKQNDIVQSRYAPTEYAFVNTYAILFTRRAPAECAKMLELFKASFGGHVDRAGVRYKMQGPQMASALFAGLLDFGKEDSHLWRLYCKQIEETDTRQKARQDQPLKGNMGEVQHLRACQRNYWNDLTVDTPVDRIPATRQVRDHEVLADSRAVVAFAAPLAFQNITLVASRIGDKNVVPFMHVVLAHLWDLSFVAGALTYVEECIPWSALVVFLNNISGSGVVLSNVEADTFPPTHGGSGPQLPEDFLMRGMMTTRHYYDADFFTGPLVDEDERTIEMPSHQAPRAERCLWLGVRLAQLHRYMTYDRQTSTFDTTEFARTLATSYV